MLGPTCNAVRDAEDVSVTWCIGHFSAALIKHKTTKATDKWIALLGLMVPEGWPKGQEAEDSHLESQAQSRKSEQQETRSLKLLKPNPADLLPLVMPHLLKAPKSASKTVPQTRDQVFKYTNFGLGGVSHSNHHVWELTSMTLRPLIYLLKFRFLTVLL